MITTEKLQSDLFEQAKNAILNFDENTIPDIYAISFWLDRLDDDPRRIRCIVGYNTISNYEKEENGVSDPCEAKWNFAFWLQNEETVLGGDAPEFQDWIRSLDSYYTDQELEADIYKCLDRMDAISEAFVEVIVPVAKRLHTEGVIRQKFGRDIPTIVHELEYYDEPLNWTRRANPDGLAAEFEQWVLSLYQ